MKRFYLVSRTYVGCKGALQAGTWADSGEHASKLMEPSLDKMECEQGLLEEELEQEEAILLDEAISTKMVYGAIGVR